MILFSSAGVDSGLDLSRYKGVGDDLDQQTDGVGQDNDHDDNDDN